MNDTTERKPEIPSGSAERWALMENAEQHAKAHPEETLTLLSLELNPWNAVYQGTSDKEVAAAALPVLDRLAKDSSEAWQAHGLNGDGFAADAANDAAEACRTFVEGPERPTDPTPPKDGGPILDDDGRPLTPEEIAKGEAEYARDLAFIKAMESGEARVTGVSVRDPVTNEWQKVESPEAAIAVLDKGFAALNPPTEPTPGGDKGAFVLIERSANGTQETGMAAHLFTDRGEAVESARGFAMSQEDALRNGQTTWAEVHPVTAQFAENFDAMQEAGRLDSMAALYSTAKEIDGHLAPAHPDEPFAITGQLKEDADDDFRAFNKAAAHLSHNAFEIDVGMGPGGMTTTITNRSRQELSDVPDSAQPEPHRPGEGPGKAIVQEAANENPRTLDPMADKGAGHYAVLKAETPEASERMADKLALVAESRDVDGDAPAAREILTRTNAESSDRQTAELAATHGVASPDGAKTTDERFAEAMAKTESELTKRGERGDFEPSQDNSQGRDFGRDAGMF